MKHYQMYKLLNDSTLSKFVTMIRSHLRDYSDTCITVKGTIDLLDTNVNENDKAQINFEFKNNAPFRSCS